MSYKVLITGTNRGIGLEFVRQYAENGWQVIACCRNPQKADQLQALQKQHNNIFIHKLDVSSVDTIQAFVRTMKDPIDLLINNAGVYGGQSQSFGEISAEALQSTFFVNTIAPLKLSEGLIDLLSKSQLKTIACVTSRMGSIHDNTSGGCYAYRASKSALNMVMKSTAIDVKHRGIKVIVLHPGWVQTDMGGPNALIDVEKSVTGLREVITSKPRLGELTFYRFDGEQIAW